MKKPIYIHLKKLSTFFFNDELFSETQFHIACTFDKYLCIFAAIDPGKSQMQPVFFNISKGVQEPKENVLLCQ